MPRLLDHDEESGVSQYFHYDPITDTVAIEYRQDVGDELDASKTLQNDDEYTRKGFKDGMWHYAHIPDVVQMAWLSEYGMKNFPLKPENKKLLFRLLNDPKWSYLKTTGKIHFAR